MSESLHADEPDTGEEVVRALLGSELPHWERRPLEHLATSGTDNAMWRVRLPGESDVVVRLPRRPHAAARVGFEADVLRLVGRADLGVATPTVRHVGSPHECFPHSWSVLEWIDGEDLWSAGSRAAGRAGDALAIDVADAVRSIAALGTLDLPARRPGQRGGPLGPLIERLHSWLDDPHGNAADLMDVDRVRRLADEASELVDDVVPETFVHGDLIPGNLLLDGDRLSAVIDWGGAGRGDPAQDLAPAWAVFDEPERTVFRRAVEADDASWLRGRTFELEHAVGGVVYYVPRRHPLGDVMARTLDRILAA